MTLRIATFNLENLGDAVGDEYELALRIDALRPQLLRLDTDILCLQEVNAQEEAGHRRSLRALEALLRETPYAVYHRAATTSASGGKPRDVQNLVILSRRPFTESREYLNDLVDRPEYRVATGDPAAKAALQLSWDRPILHAAVELADGTPLHIVNLHLRAPLPAFIPGQKLEAFVWKSVEGWAEGTFIAEIKRTGQALEARFLIDRLFDADPRASIVVLGDFNADGREAPLKILRGEVDETGNAALAGRVLTPIELSLPADRGSACSITGMP
jgi:endonuclease/exonuclease/phosphatase family metal-dependent hydrolase